MLAHKKARFEYEILKTYTAGVMLTGAEVKSLRNKSGSLSGSFVKIIGGEAFLVNAQISPYTYADNREYDPKRTRKLLLTKKELLQLTEADHQKGQVLVPLSFETAGPHIKVVVGVGRGRKQFEKRAKLREKTLEREIARDLKSKVRLT